MQSIPDNFWSWFSKFSTDDQAGMMAGAAVCVVAVIGLICLTIYKIHKTRSEDALKRELLDRGLEAEEIATIINAKSAKSCSRRWANNLR